MVPAAPRSLGLEKLTPEYIDEMKRRKASGWLFIASGSAITVYVGVGLLSLWLHMSDVGRHWFLIWVAFAAFFYGLPFCMCWVLGPVLVLRPEPGGVARGLVIACSVILIVLALFALFMAGAGGVPVWILVLVLMAIVIGASGVVILVIMM
jgi:hypothetical protein